MNKYRCDTKFSGNILVVGKTGCAKVSVKQYVWKGKRVRYQILKD